MTEFRLLIARDGCLSHADVQAIGDNGQWVSCKARLCRGKDAAAACASNVACMRIVCRMRMRSASGAGSYVCC